MHGALTVTVIMPSGAIGAVDDRRRSVTAEACCASSSSCVGLLIGPKLVH